LVLIRASREEFDAPSIAPSSVNQKNEILPAARRMPFGDMFVLITFRDAPSVHLRKSMPLGQRSRNARGVFGSMSKFY
jgi:hypothetical protein